jgi:hypothetical protein
VKRVWIVNGLVGLLGCNVPAPPRSTGGVVFGGPDGQAGEAGSTGACGRAVVIVTSDYQSTNIVVSNLDGTTLSGSFVSTGATKPGLALALSGDVDVPVVAPLSQRVLLIDRYGTNVLTWMDLATAGALAQLAVGTGFESNPHDYVDVDASRAFVSRFGTNPSPGQQAFDQGGDLLIVDTRVPAITGRIAMPEDNPALNPCPDGMTVLGGPGGEVVVTLGRWSEGFTAVGDGRFVGVSPETDTVDWTVDVTGLSSCGRLAVSPSGALAAIACSSMENMMTHQFNLSASDIVVYDATVTPPRELRRLGVPAKLGAAVQPLIAFATDDAILALTYGGSATSGDTVVAVSATTGDITPLGQAQKPFVLGGMHCSPGCGDVCLLSDAERNKLRRWQVAVDGTFTALADAVIDTVVGLPPRTIGSL